MEPVHPDDQLGRFRRLNAEEIGPLLDSYRNYLSLLARAEVGKRLQRKVDPSDLVQETFLDAHRQFGRFEGETEGELLAWLKAILAGKVANTLRRYLGTQGRDMRRELEDDVAQTLDQSSARLKRLAQESGDRPSQNLMRRESAVIVADAVQNLPPDYREVMILRHWEDLSFPQIAEQMNRSRDSVQKLWIRALARLRLSIGATI